MRAPSSPRTTAPRWRVGVSTPASSTTPSSTSEQLEAFLRERLQRWDVESAEVVCTWGSIGNMCSPEYQSQLRKAHVALRDVQKDKTRSQDGTVVSAVTRTQGETTNTARRRHRDKLAAEAQARAQAKLNAAVRRQQREQQATRKRSGGGPREVPVHPSMAVARPPRRTTASDATCREGRWQPAPPMTSPAPASTAARRLDLSSLASAAPPPPWRTSFAESQSPRVDGNVGRVMGVESSTDSSTLTLNSDPPHEAADHHESGALSSSSLLGETFSGTFVVRRRLTAHVISTQALRYTMRHHSPVNASAAPAMEAASPSPRKVQPSPPVLPARRRRSSLAAADTTTATPTSSLSPVDPSLPSAAGEVTAIFASRSRSNANPHTNTTGSQSPRGHRSRSSTAAERSATVEQRRGSAAERSPSRDYADSGSGQTHTANVTAENISPIREGPTMDDLSSISSAGSYLRGESGSK